VLSEPGPLWFLFGGAPLLLLFIVWLTVVTIVGLKGDDMERSNRIAHLYGYTVCLISLVIALISLVSLLNAAFDRANPLQSEYPFGTSLASFESYKATYRREQTMFDRAEGAKPDTVSEAALRTRYAALVQDRIAASRYRTAKSLTIGTLFLLLSIILFATHWRWVRKISAQQP
jgi:hypothetical protein